MQTRIPPNSMSHLSAHCHKSATPEKSTKITLKTTPESNIQSTLVISTSVIANKGLSRRENLVLVLTQISKIRLQNIEEKRRNCSWEQFLPFSTIFSIYISNFRSQDYIVICKIWLLKLFFPQYYKSDMSKYGYLEVFLRVPSISR